MRATKAQVIGKKLGLVWLAVLVGSTALACTREAPVDKTWNSPVQATQVYAHPPVPVIATLPDTPKPDLPIWTPTPDAARVLPGLRTEDEQYQIQFGDTLGLIAERYEVSLEALISANSLLNPDYLEVGQVLVIPAPDPGPNGPAFKVIPDSELVYGPASATFDLAAFVEGYGGYLQNYEEEVEGRTLRGAQIVQRVAQDFSVNPRLLLAVLEYQSGWVTQAQPREETLETPILVAESWRKGLYLQLSWVANNLNRGFYLWLAGGIGGWVLPDGEMVPADATINAGTAGVQYLFSLIYTRSAWDQAVTENGLLATYQAFFGYPFHWSIDPLLPPDLRQPEMRLPFEDGLDWAFTGGPHGGWGDGSAWAALDFAPSGAGLGCVTSDAWVVAVADGQIVRADQGAIIQDLDVNGEKTSDGFEQTGWVVLYMHIENRDRVQAGDYVRAGERIGHPSCEGGVSTGTHLHLARRYNGEWIPADQNTPFLLDGWLSRGTGIEYDGYLDRDDQSVEAWNGIRPENTLRR